MTSKDDLLFQIHSDVQELKRAVLGDDAGNKGLKQKVEELEHYKYIVIGASAVLAAEGGHIAQYLYRLLFP